MILNAKRSRISSPPFITRLYNSLEAPENKYEQLNKVTSAPYWVEAAAPSESWSLPKSARFRRGLIRQLMTVRRHFKTRNYSEFESALPREQRVASESQANGDVIVELWTVFKHYQLAAQLSYSIQNASLVQQAPVVKRKELI